MYRSPHGPDGPHSVPGVQHPLTHRETSVLNYCGLCSPWLQVALCPGNLQGHGLSLPAHRSSRRMTGLWRTKSCPVGLPLQSLHRVKGQTALVRTITPVPFRMCGGSCWGLLTPSLSCISGTPARGPHIRVESREVRNSTRP